MKTANEQRFLDSSGRVEQWPSHQDGKLLVLAYLASKFDPDNTYTEQEVNDLLKEWHTFDDWPLLRRELFDRGFVDRNRDGTNYHLRTIPTPTSDLVLAMPSVVRDAPIAVGWLAGDEGRETLRLMGNTDEHNKPSKLSEEQERIRGFITDSEQTTWMMIYQGTPVGAIWVDRKSTKYLPAPSPHMMIGDPAVRGKGLGEAALRTVIGLLRAENRYDRIHTRRLISNQGAARLQAKLGFTSEGHPYKDEDGLDWQNVSLDLN